jgi:hypothetical protein
MILISHIIIALASLAYTGYLFFKPSENGLKISYALVFLTLASGTYLVWSTSVNMLRVCSTGLVYLGVVLGMIAVVHRKLVKENQ